jgi:hypothetical protein
MKQRRKIICAVLAGRTDKRGLGLSIPRRSVEATGVSLELRPARRDAPSRIVAPV